MTPKTVTFFLVRTENLERAVQIRAALASNYTSTSLSGVLEGQQFVGFGCVNMDAAKIYGTIVGTITQRIDEKDQVVETVSCTMSQPKK